MFTSSKILSVVVNHFIVGHCKGTIIKHAITVELGLRNSFARLGKTDLMLYTHAMTTTCHGHELGIASTPPIIRGEEGVMAGTPH